MPQSKHVVIMVTRSDYQTLFQAVNLAATAASLGKGCWVFLQYDALATFVTDMWDRAAEPNAEMRAAFDRYDHAPLSQTLAAVRESENVQLIACSASMAMLGLDAETVLSKVDSVAGLPTIMERASESDHYHL